MEKIQSAPRIIKLRQSTSGDIRDVSLSHATRRAERTSGAKHGLMFPRQ